MTQHMTSPLIAPSRRDVLKLGLNIGLGAACSAAASPLITPVALAAAPSDNRLVVIILRGAMDGLDVIAPYGDPHYAALRPTLAQSPKAPDGATDLDGFFALHPRLKPLAPLWRAGELAAVHATSTPYRDGRSHFDGQDVLENGADAASDANDGWLNRALSAIPGAPAQAEVRYAMAVGRRHMLLLEGDAPAGSWSPTTDFTLDDDERRILEHLYAGDPLFQQAAADAAVIGAEAHRRAKGGDKPAALARFAAGRLKAESRIAGFSIGGWDTHINQKRGINPALNALTQSILTLKSELGPIWRRTTVIAVTEFGRTARENGAKGTDHGSGGVALLAGGAINGGRVYNGPVGAGNGFAGWPGLGESDLYENRDLNPTEDVRRIAAWALAGLFGAPLDKLSRDVFPGLDLGAEPSLFL